jgi:hypothetical protein
LEHPVVAMYRYENEQLFKINFAVFSIEALNSLAQEPSRFKLLFKQSKYEEQELVSCPKKKTNQICLNLQLNVTFI